MAAFQNDQINKLSEKFEEVSLQVECDTRRLVEKGLNSVLEIARENVSRTMTDGADTMVKLVRGEMSSALAEHRAEVNSFKRSVRLMRSVMWVGIFILGGLGIGLLTVLAIFT